jgi:hypothetical protein
MVEGAIFADQHDDVLDWRSGVSLVAVAGLGGSG